jgi:hypothetical protein
MKGIFKFVRNFLFGFLLTWYAIDMWKLCKGDLHPLWRKGINIEWLVNTKQSELSESVDDIERDNRTYIGFRVTYTYSEPIILRKTE